MTADRQGGQQSERGERTTAEAGRTAVEKLRAAVVGGDLSVEVALDVAQAASARTPRVRGRLVDEALDESLAVVLARADDLETRDLGPLFEDSLARGGH